LPGRAERRASLGHTHVLGPELRSFEGARAVLFKLLAKAAMRLRNERYLAAGLAIRMRFVGMDKRFERDLAFAPLDDTPTLLRLLGDELASLETAIHRRRWNVDRHPPLSVAVTLTQLEPVGSITQELMASRGRAKAISATLDSINRRYGNNTLYFGAMQEALEQDAAPMRIPFATIPEAVLEEDVGARKPADTAEELWLERERQFKVMAEAAHRKAKEQPERVRAISAKPYGAGGWTRNAPAEPEAPGTTGSLF
jgi:DNA polymerase-4